jgi:citrate/tricarballylate utilization protein
MQICNACRYCEGFCAVFPAMTRRLEFGKADVHYLANLCHNCGACLHACQYAPPHEFAVNVPQAMAQVRGQTYADYAWPPALGALYQPQRPDASRWPWRGAGAVPGCWRWPSTAPLWRPWTATSTRSFRTTCWWACLRRCSASRCWRWEWACALLARARRPSGAPLSGPAAAEALARRAAPEIPRRRPWRGLQQRRRRLDPVAPALPPPTFYGFMLCFAATSVATLYHYGWAGRRPTTMTSLPKLLGMSAASRLLVGHRRAVLAEPASPSAARRPAQRPMDRGFIALLLLTRRAVACC